MPFWCRRHTFPLPHALSGAIITFLLRHTEDEEDFEAELEAECDSNCGHDTASDGFAITYDSDA